MENPQDMRNGLDNKIKIGTSGFSFPDWIGEVYPKGIKPSQMLEYYENELGFNACEINYTYYRMPDPYTISRLEKRTSDGFEFTVKAFREMTHEIKENGKYIFSDFLRGVEPLLKKRKLGALLLQFPQSFKNTQENIAYIETCKKRLKGLPLVIEFRDNSWLNAKTDSLLRKDKIGICVVDEPKLNRLAPYEPNLTSDTGYFRFHGRNKNWYEGDAHERYNYNYSQSELEGFIPGIKKIAKSAKKTFLFFNNCFMGQSAKNALQVRELLGLKFQKRSPKLF